MNSSTALTTPNLSSAIEAALINGDLKQLDTPGRLQYYKSVCESVGLNPLTKPFDYIVLNGKLTLYANRNCTEQLRKIYGVAITSMKPEQVGDLLVVTVTAQDKAGRTDASTGAVPTKGLSGENLANAMMKAETKAKRRVTLSLCGLGLLDETEVASIADARPFSEPQTNVVALPKPQQSFAQEMEEAANVFKVLDNNRVISTVLDVVSKTTSKGTKCKVITLAGQVEGRDVAWCYHQGLFDALSHAKGEVCQFEWELKGDWLTIVDVLGIGEVEYRDGKPYTEPEESVFKQQLRASLEITDADIPDSLFTK